MSRRSRRRSGGRGAWVVRALVSLLAVAALVMGGGYLWVRSWLHSDGFRQMMSREAARALEAEAEAEFGPFSWDGTTMRTPTFEANGTELVRKVDAAGMRVDIEVGAVKRRVLELSNVRLKQLDVALDLTGKEAGGLTVVPAAEGELAADGPSSAPKKAKWYERYLPQELELGNLEVDSSVVELGMKSGPAAISGTSWRVMPDQARGSYRVEADGGEIRLPWEFAPTLDLREARFRYQRERVYLTESVFSLFERGRLLLSGEASLRGEGFSFDGDLTDVKAAELLPEDWKQRLEGDVSGSFSVTSSEGSKVRVAGEVALANGVLTGLPVLDSLGAYGGNPRFRRLLLNDARTDFRWQDGALVLSDLVIGSEGLVRVEGSLRVGKDDTLDGEFRLGLVPGTLDLIPGAETKVFLPGERGLLWTSLRISGTVDDPKEDLTDRLIDAAGLRMFEILPESGERVLKFTRKVVGDDLAKRLENPEDVLIQGREVLRQGKDVLRQGKDILKGDRDAIRGAEEVVREVGGLLDALRGKEEEPEVPPNP